MYTDPTISTGYPWVSLYTFNLQWSDVGPPNSTTEIERNAQLEISYFVVYYHMLLQ